MFNFRGFFNDFPYTDFHELNLDFLLGKVGKVDKAVADVTEAATTATEAATDAQTASVTAVEAKNAAVNARNSAVSAKLDAESARDAAQTAATNAAGSATTASQRAAAALASQTAAESAKTAAETARDAAQTARSGAQTARSGAETAATNAANSATAAAASASSAASSAAAITFRREALGSDVNFDTVTDTGIYLFSSTTNSVNPPGSLTNAYMQVFSMSGSSRVCQIAYGGRTNVFNMLYIRHCYNAEWTPWKVIYFDEPSSETVSNTYVNVTASATGGTKQINFNGFKSTTYPSTGTVNVGTLSARYRPSYDVSNLIPVPGLDYRYFQVSISASTGSVILSILPGTSGPWEPPMFSMTYI